ncbi:MAG: ABC transporter permease [Pseudomonadota bacterium]
MTWLRLAVANLGLSPLTSAVNVLLMALGTASIVLLLLAGSQLSETMSRDARGIDLVLGATGSPVQLVLSAVYHADVPPGNVRLEEALRWADDPRVRTAIPLSLGDSYRGYRIVGTTADYAELYEAGLATGRFWDGTLEAVAGSAVAQSAGLGVGSSFAGAHGLEEGGHSHESDPYRIVGVLEPTGTVVDRLILTSLTSVWDLHAEETSHAHTAGSDHADDHDHDHDSNEAHKHDENHDHEAVAGQDQPDPDREITAMLIRYSSPMAAMTLSREVNSAGVLQAAAPAMEVSRILQLIGIGLDGLSAFSWVLILTAALSVFAALYGSLRARRGDLAILRCLGATRWELLVALLLEGLLLSVLGVTLGFLAGHGAMELLGAWLENTRGVAMTGWTWVPAQTLLLFGLFGVGAVAAAIPAVQAYRTDVARTLAEG